MTTLHPPAALNPSPFSPGRTRLLEATEMAFWNALYDAAPPEAVRDLGLGRLRVGEGWAYVAPGADVLALNKTLGLGLGRPATEDAIGWLAYAYAEAGARRFFVQLSPAAGPPAVYRWLEAAGFRHHNDWMKLVRDLALPALEVPTRFRIETIGPAHADAFGQLVAPAFDWPAPMAAALAGTVGRPGWHHYLAFDGDAPAAAAGLFMHGSAAYFGPAVTLAAYRRQGAQSALVARRIRDARAMGARLAIAETAAPRVDHAAPSYRNLRRMGFAIAYRRPNYLYTL